MPKEMLPVVDRPLIQYAVDEARAAGIEEFVFVTGRAKSAIEDHFDHSFELERSLTESGKLEAVEELRAWMPAPVKYLYGSRCLLVWGTLFGVHAIILATNPLRFF